MSLISTWSTVANDNGTLGSTPFYWPEGQAPSTVNDCARLMMATIRTQWNDAQWFNWGYTVAKVSGNSFTVVTASWNTVTVANVFATGGRIKLADSVPNTLYGTITTVSVSAASVQVSFTPDTNSLTATLVTVFNSIITPDQKSIPSGSVPADVVRQSGAQIYGVDGGVSDAYAIAMTPTLTSYIAGQSFNFKANSENVGPATLNIDGLGAKAIVNPDGSALTDGQIPAGAITHVVFDGTNFQMANSGSGTASSSSGRFIDQKLIKSGTAATYTVPANVHQITVQIVGGGGGGGGCQADGSHSSQGAGGGAGGYSQKTYNTTPGTTYLYTVGTGGAGGAAGANGADGTTTTFDVLTATHGFGGDGAGATSPSMTRGGVVGSGSGGDLNYQGGAGLPGICINGFLNGGGGGDSFLGGGGGGAYEIGSSGAVQQGGDAGINSGSGGGGAAGTTVLAGARGGNGGDGLIIISEYS